MGRPLSDITSKLAYDGFIADAEKVLARSRTRSSAKCASAKRELVSDPHRALSDGGRSHRRRGRDLHRHHAPQECGRGIARKRNAFPRHVRAAPALGSLQRRRWQYPSSIRFLEFIGNTEEELNSQLRGTHRAPGRLRDGSENLRRTDAPGESRITFDETVRPQDGESALDSNTITLRSLLMIQVVNSSPCRRLARCGRSQASRGSTARRARNASAQSRINVPPFIWTERRQELRRILQSPLVTNIAAVWQSTRRS